MLSGQLMIATTNQSEGKKEENTLSSIRKVMYYEFSRPNGIVLFPVRLRPIIYYKFSFLPAGIANRIERIELPSGLPFYKATKITWHKMLQLQASEITMTNKVKYNYKFCKNNRKQCSRNVSNTQCIKVRKVGCGKFVSSIVQS